MIDRADDCQGARLEPLIFDRSRPGHRGAAGPSPGVDVGSAADLLAGAALRDRPPALPELSEPEVVRHYTRLSRLNHSVDLGMYPLGSCTMKYNPKLNDKAAAMPGFSQHHPLAPCSGVCPRCALAGKPLWLPGPR